MNVLSIEWELHTVPLLYEGWRAFFSWFRADFSSVLIVLHLNFVSLCSCYKCRIEFAECSYVSFSGKSGQHITDFREVMPLEKQCGIRIGCLIASKPMLQIRLSFTYFTLSGFLLMHRFFLGIKAQLFQHCKAFYPSVFIVANIIACCKWLIFPLLFLHWFIIG